MAISIPPPFTGVRADSQGNATFEFAQYRDNLVDIVNNAYNAYQTAYQLTVSKKDDWQDALDAAYNSVHHAVVDPVMTPIRTTNKQGAQNAFSFWLTTCTVPPTSAERQDKRVYFNGQAKAYTQSSWQSNYNYFVTNKLALAVQDPSVITAYAAYQAALTDEIAKHLDWHNASRALGHANDPVNIPPYPPFPPDNYP